VSFHTVPWPERFLCVNLETPWGLLEMQTTHIPPVDNPTPPRRMVIDGQLSDCCAGRGPDEQTLRAAGLGQPLPQRERLHLAGRVHESGGILDTEVVGQFEVSMKLRHYRHSSSGEFKARLCYSDTSYSRRALSRDGRLLRRNATISAESAGRKC